MWAKHYSCQNFSVDFVSRLGGLGGLIWDRASLAYWFWCTPASRKACSARTLGSDTIWETDIQPAYSKLITYLQLFPLNYTTMFFFLFLLWAGTKKPQIQQPLQLIDWHGVLGILVVCWYEGKYCHLLCVFRWHGSVSTKVKQNLNDWL